MMTSIIKKDSNIETFKNSYYINKPTKKETILLDIDDSEKHRIRYWAKIDGEYYFIKRSRMLNEIVGQILAKELGLKTAEYIPINYFNELLFKTPNFKEEDYEYHRLDYYFNNLNQNNIEQFKKILNTQNYNKLKIQILKLFSIDIFMRQLDRCLINVLFQQKNNEILLAPLFDYSASFMGEAKNFKYYDNIIQSIDINNMKDFFEKYPEMIEILGKTTDINTIKLLKDELDKYNLNFHSKLNEYYTQEFDASKKMLEKIIS